MSRERDRRAETVTRTRGCVAFWDFSTRETGGARRFLARIPGRESGYALDAGNYVRDYWGEGRAATYDDFPTLGRGPFGDAVRIRKETDPTFRPFLFVPRARLHDTPLDIKGEYRAVSVVVWAIRESGNHALAGIWHEGTDLKQDSTATIKTVERGQRQYALFAGLSKEGTACGHVSENGGSSFLNRYAVHKCNSEGVAAPVAADAPPEILDRSWHTFAMTLDPKKWEITGWLDGVAGERWVEFPTRDSLLTSAGNAWLQAHLRKKPGVDAGEDPAFPTDQLYAPPETRARSVETLNETSSERVERRTYGYTRVRVTLRRAPGGKWIEASRALDAIRINPWWYPHKIYSPPDEKTGGPFTIGRVIHSSRSVGFTGWIGGVAVFYRALAPSELKRLAELAKDPVSAKG